MTEHVVLRRASDARADLQHRRELALIALDALDEEIREVDLFIEMYQRFSGEVQDECAIHLPNNSNNAPAEDARLEDDSGPSKEGDTTSAATDGIAGTSVSSADPDGGGSNSAIIGQVTLPERWGEFVALAEPTEATLHRPLPAQETAKPTCESDVFPPTPPLSTRVKAVLTAHPDWTARQIGDELGIDQSRVNDVAKTRGLTLRRLTPEEIRQKRVEGARKGGQISRTPAPGPVPEIPVKLKDRIIACHKAHPDWDTHQIAEAIGEKVNSVSAYKSMLRLPIPARPRAPSKGPRKFVAPAQADDGEESRRRKYGESQKQPIEAADQDDESTDSPFQTPPAPRLPPGRKLYLTDGRGNYLDWSCTRMVRPQRGSDGQFKNVWIGTDRQAGACRRNYEVARDLHAVIVPKPTRPIL